MEEATEKLKKILALASEAEQEKLRAELTQLIPAGKNLRVLAKRLTCLPNFVGIGGYLLLRFI